MLRPILISIFIELHSHSLLCEKFMYGSYCVMWDVDNSVENISEYPDKHGSGVTGRDGHLMSLHQQNPTVLENSLNAFEALQVGFKSILRSHCMQLDIT